MNIKKDDDIDIVAATIYSIVLMVFTFCILILAGLYKRTKAELDYIKEHPYEIEKNVSEQPQPSTKDNSYSCDTKYDCSYENIKEDMLKYSQYLPDKSLHSWYIDEYKHPGFCGYYQGELGVESYYNLNLANSEAIVNTMRCLGYSEKEYPFWLREDGVYMLGDYIMCCTDDEYKYGDIVPTSLGKGIVCDHSSFGRHIDISYGDERIVGTYILDIYTDWY